MRSRIHRFAAVAAAIVVACSAAAAQRPLSLLISPQELKTGLRDPSLVLLYVGPKDEYAKEHIAGARFVDLSDIALNDQANHIALDLPDEADLRARLEKLGIGDKSRVVVTPGADWGSPATRVVWTLQAAGLGGQTRLLNGGTLGWKAAGFPLTADVPPTVRGTLTLAADRSVVVDHAWVEAHEKSPHIRIIDARSPNFFDGPGSPSGVYQGKTYAGTPGGHIPGARNIPFNTLFDDSVHFHPSAELRKAFDAAGVIPGDTVVAYCHVGQQATAVLFAARILGYPIRLYDGSMTDWQFRNLPLEGWTSVKSATPARWMDATRAGVALGFVLLASFVLTGRGLGASGAFAVVAGDAVGVVAPGVMSNSALADRIPSGIRPWSDWIVLEIVGVFIGAGVSARVAGRWRAGRLSPVHQPPSRLVRALAGGALMGVGARLAYGCTSGLGLTGGALLATGAWVFIPVAFATAFVVTSLARDAYLEGSV